jgi:hypothetical protein
MNTKSRITYRFDHSTPSNKQESQAEAKPNQAFKPKVVPIRQEDSYISSIPPWNSPFQEDATALEKLIREESHPGHGEEPISSDSEIPFLRMEPAAREKERQSLRWSLPPLHEPGPLVDDVLLTKPLVPNQSDAYDGISGSYSAGTTLRPSRGPSWLKVLASVSGAIVTGALFGYLVLSLFADQSPLYGITGTPKDTKALPVQTSEAPDTSAAAGNQAQAESGTVKVSMPGRSYYLLQYGLFSGKEGMDAAAEQLKSQGYAAASDDTDGYRVYAGIAKDKNSAASLSTQLGGLAVFVKAVDLPEAAAIHFSGDIKTAQSFFDKTDQLILLLDEMTVAKLDAAAPAPFSNEETEAWKTVHQTWTRAAAEIKKGLGAEDAPAADRMIKAINTAAISLDEYDKNPSRSHLWTVQSSLTAAVLAQKQFT